MTADANLFYENGALLDQIELQLADLEENAAQVETAAQLAAADKITVAPFARRKPALRRLPEHLPRERLFYPAPTACLCLVHFFGGRPSSRKAGPAAEIRSGGPPPRNKRPHFFTLLASILIAGSSSPVVNALSTAKGFSMPR